MGFLSKLIPSWVPLVLVLFLTSAIAILYSVKETEISKLKLQISETKTNQSTDLVVKTEAVRDTEQTLNNNSNNTKSQTNEKVRIVIRDSAELLERVRLAEERLLHSPVSETSAVTSVGDASRVSDEGELLNQLGTKDVQEATRADTIRLHLESCYNQYNRAKAELEKLK